MQDSEAIDLAVLVMLLAVLITVSFGLVMPLVRESWVQSKQIITDKTIEKQVGEVIETSVVGISSMKPLEVVLATQVQDYGMPEPKTIEANGQIIDITPTYKESVLIHGIQVWDKLKEMDNTLTDSYEIVYDDRNTATKADDTYKIIKK